LAAKYGFVTDSLLPVTAENAREPLPTLINLDCPAFAEGYGAASPPRIFRVFRIFRGSLPTFGAGGGRRRRFACQRTTLPAANIPHYCGKCKRAGSRCGNRPGKKHEKTEFRQTLNSVSSVDTCFFNSLPDRYALTLGQLGHRLASRLQSGRLLVESAAWPATLR
jgi:hypothetical protein